MTQAGHRYRAYAVARAEAGDAKCAVGLGSLASKCLIKVPVDN